ncbi:hypothetical protein [Nocardia sp. CDC160]|uniref:hypothetical protein n=1 Tax=Nocardia sp. CDC160 TaxID=3112166 RepID=UPI002DB5BBF3|nr:hypothetical protein [Nocardia sp. CDC160]MEC3919325.1 hypothetical protein [Nocardia sp. CDC160]
MSLSHALHSAEMRFEAFLRTHRVELSVEPRWQGYYDALAERPYYAQIAPSTGFSCHTLSDAYAQILACLRDLPPNPRTEIELHDARLPEPTLLLAMRSTHDEVVRHVRREALSHETAKALVILRSVDRHSRLPGRIPAVLALARHDREEFYDLVEILDWARTEAAATEPTLPGPRLDDGLVLWDDEIRARASHLDIERELSSRPMLPQARRFDAALREWLTGSADYTPPADSAAPKTDADPNAAADIRTLIDIAHPSEVTAVDEPQLQADLPASELRSEATAEPEVGM